MGNQLVGPPFFKLALRKSGEAFIDHIGGTQLVTVHGQEPQIEVKHLSWEVRAGAGGSRVAIIAQKPTVSRLCSKFEANSMVPLLGEPSAKERPSNSLAFISMLEDDEANYQACQLAQNTYGINRVIV